MGNRVDCGLGDCVANGPRESVEGIRVDRREVSYGLLLETNKRVISITWATQQSNTNPWAILRYRFAKECVGSNRIEKNDRNFPLRR
jgi:hypothetical protein